ncbi:hypothetical protein CDD82_1515 [Ophiocordyceps australis]|uniref:Restriction endonuclease type IV Mrr domain-containing protein n=1 Tax=Ophiocordyceps australis TaxID=1399860 RepID=A0A2C5ZID5_9HYPO|nr:hypothetical protein CDD82_1515 [Ophiocordyceps australis]
MLVVRYRSCGRSWRRAHLVPRVGIQRQWYSSGNNENSKDDSHVVNRAKPTWTQHSDLATFLSYAQRSGLDPKSTTYVGTHYEYTVAAALFGYGFTLKRIGGVSDRGTDLIGMWTLPTRRTSGSSWPLALRVVVQCKYGSGRGRVGPQHVRELEGAFAGAPAGWRGGGVVGVLVGEAAATRGVRDALGRSRWPMVFASCSREGRVEQLLWNGRAEEEGLEGLSVGVRHGQDQSRWELVLLHHGQVARWRGTARHSEA